MVRSGGSKPVGIDSSSVVPRISCSISANQRADTKDCSVWRHPLAHLTAASGYPARPASLATSRVQQYSVRSASLTVHRTCTQTRPSFGPLTPQPNAIAASCGHASEHIQIGGRRLGADGAYYDPLRVNKSQSNGFPPGAPPDHWTPKSPPVQSLQMAMGVSIGLFCVVFRAKLE